MNDSAPKAVQGCALCQQAGGELVFQGAQFRVILVDDAAFPGFCRVVWTEHVREMSDLEPGQRSVLMDAVWAVEAALLETMAPTKVNLASLGNMVAHMHWHVIPRFADDSHFPGPVWAAPQRSVDAVQSSARQEKLPALREALKRRLLAL
ncbi:MAG: HIT family protein [Janthinobacterium lividum]